ncbi:hypothetical protein Anapl_15498 [Anas platyrhynchos]|uniref:Uncharacterized protein n=1 Tax=Anas platyrhynchos TaxID=8839 RepID=R0KN93_ANAPL|nr:hypothetical protein Anapl_15498 [Anas platyrhynchos]
MLMLPSNLGLSVPGVQQVLERGCSGLGEGTGRQWKELGEGCCNVVPSAEDSDAIWVTRSCDPKFMPPFTAAEPTILGEETPSLFASSTTVFEWGSCPGTQSLTHSFDKQLQQHKCFTFTGKCTMPRHEVSTVLGFCSPPALAVRSVAAEHPEVELKTTNGTQAACILPVAQLGGHGGTTLPLISESELSARSLRQKPAVPAASRFPEPRCPPSPSGGKAPCCTCDYLFFTASGCAKHLEMQQKEQHAEHRVPVQQPVWHHRRQDLNQTLRNQLSGAPELLCSRRHLEPETSNCSLETEVQRGEVWGHCSARSPNGKGQILNRIVTVLLLSPGVFAKSALSSEATRPKQPPLEGRAKKSNHSCKLESSGDQFCLNQGPDTCQLPPKGAGALDEPRAALSNAAVMLLADRCTRVPICLLLPELSRSGPTSEPHCYHIAIALASAVLLCALCLSDSRGTCQQQQVQHRASPAMAEPPQRRGSEAANPQGGLPVPSCAGRDPAPAAGELLSTARYRRRNRALLWVEMQEPRTAEPPRLNPAPGPGQQMGHGGDTLLPKYSQNHSTILILLGNAGLVPNWSKLPELPEADKGLIIGSTTECPKGFKTNNSQHQHNACN